MASVRTLVFFGIVLIEAISALVFLSVFLIFADRATDRHAHASLNWAMDSVQHEVRRFFQNASTAVNAAADLSATAILNPGNKESLSRYFFETLRGDADLTGLFHADAKGDFVFVTREHPFMSLAPYFGRIIENAPDGVRQTDMVIDDAYTRRYPPDRNMRRFDPRLRPWYKAAINRDEPSWTEPYQFFSSRAPDITIARGVTRPGGAGRSVFGVDLSLLSVSRFMEGLSLSPGARVYLADRSGHLIAFPGYKLKTGTGGAAVPTVAEHGDEALRAAARLSGIWADQKQPLHATDLRYEVGGTPFLAVFQPLNLGYVDWVTVAIVPEGDFIGWFREVRWATLGLVLILSLSAMFAGWLLWRRIDLRLAVIRDQATKMSRRDPDAFHQPRSGLRELASTENALTAMAGEIMRREEQNRIVTARLERIVAGVDYAPVAIAIFDPEGLVIYENAMVARLLQLPDAERGSRPARQIVEAVDALRPPPEGGLADASEAPSLRVALAYFPYWEAELLRCETGDGRPEATFYAIAATLSSSGGGGAKRRGGSGSEVWCLVLEDATNRRKTEHALMVAAGRAQEASLVKSQFLAAMSHELRTPLNLILGFSELMQNEAFGPLGSERYKEYVEGISSSGRGLLDIVTNILDLMAVESGRMRLSVEDIDLHALIGRVVEGEAGRCDDAEVTVVNRARPGCRAYADPFRLERVMFSLLDNAIRYAGRGATVTIDAEQNVYGTDIVVTDDGPGMPKGLAEFVPEPFRRHAGDADIAVAGGMGLGLALVHSVVALHGGTVKLQTPPGGKGLRVFIRLPLSRGR